MNCTHCGQPYAFHAPFNFWSLRPDVENGSSEEEYSHPFCAAQAAARNHSYIEARDFKKSAHTGRIFAGLAVPQRKKAPVHFLRVSSIQRRKPVSLSL